MCCKICQDYWNLFLFVAPSKNSTIINSPYLNFDPRYSSNYTPEFIFPEGASKQRGRFELAFSQIGSSVMIGGGIGGIAGFYNGRIFWRCYK